MHHVEHPGVPADRLLLRVDAERAFLGSHGFLPQTNSGHNAICNAVFGTPVEEGLDPPPVNLSANCV